MKKHLLIFVALFTNILLLLIVSFWTNKIQDEINEVKDQYEELAILKRGNVEFKDRYQVEEGMAFGHWILDKQWNRITVSILEGFDANLGLTIKEEENFEQKEALKVEGGEVSKRVYLVDANGNEIRNKTDLLNLIGTIDSEEEAMSLVAITTGDIQIDNNVVVGFTYTLDDHWGYLVQVTNQNTFGCGIHEYLKEIYLVTNTGDVTLAVYELPDENKFEGLCID